MIRIVERCWLCLRITPKQIFSAAHAIWKDYSLAHEISALLSSEIWGIYARNPTALCGKPGRTIIAGGLYIIGIAKNSPESQFRISRILKCTESGLRLEYRTLLPLMRKEIVEAFKKNDTVKSRKGGGVSSYARRDRISVGDW